MQATSFGVDVLRLIELLSDRLYADHSVFLRELIANAHDAIIRRRSKLDPSAPPDSRAPALNMSGSIVLSIEPNGVLRICDDGCGIARDEVHDALGRIAHSGTRTARRTSPNGSPLIGQFGVGLLSAFAVSETITIRSRATTDTCGLTWKWTRGDEYYVADAPDIDSPGTEITLKLSDTAATRVDPDKIQSHIREMLPYLAVEVYVEHDRHRDLVTTSNPPWRVTEDISGAALEAFLTTSGVDGAVRTLFRGILRLKDGGGALFVRDFRAHSSSSDLRFYVCGVFVRQAAHQIVAGEPFLDLLSGVLELRDIPLSLDRTAIAVTEPSAKERLARLREEISSWVVEQLSALVAEPEGATRLESLVAARRSAFLALLSRTSDQAALLQLGRYYTFETTFGPLSLRAIEQEHRNHRIFWTKRAPAEEERWAVELTAGGLAVHVDGAGEERLFLALCRAANLELCEWTLLGPGVTPDGLPPPPSDLTLRAFAERIRRTLGPYGINVSARSYQTPAPLSVLVQHERRPTGDEPLDRLMASWHRSVDPESAGHRATLFLNERNEHIGVLARGRLAHLPADTAAFALLAFAAMQGFDAVGANTRKALRELGHQVAAKAPLEDLTREPRDRIRCFVAYDFGSTQEATLFKALKDTIEKVSGGRWEVIDDRADAQESDYLFVNLRRKILDADRFIAIFSPQSKMFLHTGGATHIDATPITENPSPAWGPLQAKYLLNPNVLVEVGVSLAAAPTDRRLIFVDRRVPLSADLGGFLWEPFDTDDIDNEKKATEFVTNALSRRAGFLAPLEPRRTARARGNRRKAVGPKRGNR